ncbi:alkyl sulfatase BDS1-like metallo-beta-lactamase superfamily hydrolase [Caulobacter sp. BE264]|uniref:alkyl/aryl-sulfatase n=1 Tax=Caulobacter sp. BE264 TaxID=2817724 RepID=UPI002861DCD5|nr:alkyl sulfatase dimerization domain-containing protein [Caulobacter sp. BE264]MDR7231834.1 alkyl sulfatase BDS1-like metallo-beta-lactamase superfamily hydrolase [Caulobacter sp. BE264]
MRKGMFAATALAMLMVASVAKAGDPASPITAERQAAFAKTLPVNDRQDFDFADKGFLGTRTDPVIKRADGQAAWNLATYEFLKAEPPATVNPSLWRQAQLLSKHGLYQVSERVYQVRGFDISNITFVRGDTGWIVIDPLTMQETARAALDLVNEKLGKLPVTAVVYTHSHSDHFGGVRGVVDEADVKSGKVPIVAPKGFMEEVAAENIVAGNAMSRRAQYQFGVMLPPGVEGQITAGIGQNIARGSITLIPPTLIVDHTGQELTLDGVKVRFQYTPSTEAPAEMNLYFPDLRILDMAENANVSMHNILTPRGALVRDSKAWADGLTEALRLFGDVSDIMITSHGWPRFGGGVVKDFLASHRDAYKYLHDQTVRMMNHGLTGDEIAAKIQLPPSLSKDWFNRGYYGSMSFNSRAVFQRYMGWYDANPAHLIPSPPADAGKRYVVAMGGAAKVKTMAKEAATNGDYGWAAALLNHAVMADDGDKEAKRLLAGVYDQLGYQAENSLWRNMYLTASDELRGGVRKLPPSMAPLDMIAALESQMIFDVLAIRLNADKAGDGRLRMVFAFPDRNERFLVEVRNGVLVAQPSKGGEGADATLTVDRPVFLDSLFGGKSLLPKILKGEVKLEGDRAAMSRLAGWFDAFPSDFPIVTRPN